MRILSFTSTLLGASLVTRVALACGGMFCAQPPLMTPTAPAPVDQTSERIIFEVFEGTITAHVQIAYLGESERFAWIVPVPNTPTVAESSIELFQALDEASSLQVMLPAQEPCPPQAQPTSGGGGGGFGCSSDDGAIFDAAAPPAPAPSAKPPVTVYSMGFTDNFELSVIGAEDTNDLIVWLNDNEYNVSPNMTPVMDVYNGGGTQFLALKLRAGKEASDIAPIKMTYAAEKPMIPIQLTAIAAQPHMGILVFIVGTDMFEPENFMHSPPDSTRILFDENGQTNYFEDVARESDERGGKFFSTEYIGRLPISNAQSYGGQQLRGTRLSRYYTRLSPEHMTEDPVFAAEPRASNVPNMIDLTGRPSVLRCNSPIVERVPSACAFNYCGQDAECVELNGAAACRCPAGKVATQVTGPSGTPKVTCTPRENPVGVIDDPTMAGTEFDPCMSTNCGSAGTCALKGGFPVCTCNDGAAATAVGDGVRCEPAAADLETFGPGAGPESAGRMALRIDQIANPKTMLAASLWTLLGMMLWLGRRRR